MATEPPLDNLLKYPRATGLVGSVPAGPDHRHTQRLRQLTHDEILGCLKRHAAGDWDDLDGKTGEPTIVPCSTAAVCLVAIQQKRNEFWVITGAHYRSSCVLLPAPVVFPPPCCTRLYAELS